MTRAIRARVAVLGLLPFVLGAAPVRVLEPSGGSVGSFMPLDAVIDFDAAGDEGTLLIELNGTDVTGLFSLGPVAAGRRTASASDAWGSFVLEGSNLLEASIDVGAQSEQASASFTLSGDPFADAVVSFTVGTNGGLNGDQLELALGAPLGGGAFQGSFDIVSLGLSGEIVLRFDDNVILDGPGVDFTVFENAFLVVGAGNLTQPPFAEPGRVSVSQDGQSWYVFDCPYDDSDAGPYWPGCAGIYPVFSDGSGATPDASVPTTEPIESLVGVPVLSFVAPPGSGGDSFDLAGSGLGWVRYVRIEAAPFVTTVPGPTNAAFDIDAVAAVNSAPAPPLAVPSLGTAGLILLALLLALTARGVAGAQGVPSVAAAPAPHSDAAPPAPSIEERLAEIARRVQSATRYPAIARARGVSGETLVAFEIDARGAPQAPRIVETSGNGALDRAALRAIENAAPLPFVYGAIEVPVRFTLLDP